MRVIHGRTQFASIFGCILDNSLAIHSDKQLASLRIEPPNESKRVKMFTLSPFPSLRNMSDWALGSSQLENSQYQWCKSKCWCPCCGDMPHIFSMNSHFLDHFNSNIIIFEKQLNMSMWGHSKLNSIFQSNTHHRLGTGRILEISAFIYLFGAEDTAKTRSARPYNVLHNAVV